MPHLTPGPPLHQSRWLSLEKLQVLFLPLAGTAGGTSAFSFCFLPFCGCSGTKLVTLVTVSPELQKKNGLRWSQRLFIAENQNGKGTSGAQKLLKAPCGSIQGRATSQLDRKCLTLSPEMSTSLHSLLAKVKMMRWDGLRLLMGCSKFKFSRGASLLTLFRDVKTDGWLISTLIGHSVASYLLHDWLLMTSPKIYMYSN